MHFLRNLSVPRQLARRLGWPLRDVAEHIIIPSARAILFNPPKLALCRMTRLRPLEANAETSIAPTWHGLSPVP